MGSILIKNIGALVTGKLENPLREADSIFIKNGVVEAIANGLRQPADQTIDANGITAINSTTVAGIRMRSPPSEIGMGAL